MCYLLGTGLGVGLSRIGVGIGPAFIATGTTSKTGTFTVRLKLNPLKKSQAYTTIRRIASASPSQNQKWTNQWLKLRPSVHLHLFQHHKCSYSLISSRFISNSASTLKGPTTEQRQQNKGHSDQNQRNDSSSSRQGANSRSILEERHRTVLYYLCAVAVLVAGASYAAVPLYRIFCQSYSYGGTVATHSADKDLSKMKKVKHRELTVKFNADKSSSLQWSFVPRQSEIILYPGETALAFYTATNSTNRPIDGISTYNVIPYEVGQYFNKIQCFCFEEQRLNPGETVELPVFFYIDPEFSDDPKMEDVDTILLSYTFFEAKEVPHLSLPSFSSLKLTS